MDTTPMKLEERAKGLFLDGRRVVVKMQGKFTEIRLALREGECPERRDVFTIPECPGECHGWYARIAFDDTGTFRAVVGLADVGEPYLRRDVGRCIGLQTDKELLNYIKHPDVIWQDLIVNDDVRGRQAMYDGQELMRTYTCCTFAIHPGNEGKFDKEVRVVTDNFERIVLYAAAHKHINK